MESGVNLFLNSSNEIDQSNGVDIQDMPFLPAYTDLNLCFTKVPVMDHVLPFWWAVSLIQWLISVERRLGLLPNRWRKHGLSCWREGGTVWKKLPCQTYNRRNFKPLEVLHSFFPSLTSRSTLGLHRQLIGLKWTPFYISLSNCSLLRIS